MLHGFGCHVLVYDPYVTAEALSEAAEKVELPELLARARIVSLHARATAENKGMIGTKELSMDAEGLRAHQLRARFAGAVRSRVRRVGQRAPVGSRLRRVPGGTRAGHSRLLRTPHTVMTPHIAGASKQTAEKAARIAAEEVRRYLAGEALRNCANPEAAER